MKVVLLTNLPANLDEPRGGVQSTAVALLRALSQWTDFEVHAAAVNSSVESDRDVSFGRVELHYRRAARVPVLLGAITQQRRIVSELLRALKPDIIHACDTSYFKVEPSLRPVVYQIQGTIAEDSRFEGPLGRVVSPAWRWLERRAVREADAVIVNAAPVARLIAPLRTEHVFVCEEPVHEDFLAVTRQSDARRVLCVGQVTPLKNCVALVEAAAVARSRGVDCEVRFAGDGPAGYLAGLRRTIARLGLKDRCYLLGRLSRAELIAELAAAAVLAHPSRREHLPAAIVEAMVVGVPVVASRVGGIPDIIDDQVTGFLIDPADVRALADRLCKLLSDEPLRARLSKDAQDVARRRFHPRPAVQRLTDCYQTVLGSPRQSSRLVAVA